MGLGALASFFIVFLMARLETNPQALYLVIVQVVGLGVASGLLSRGGGLAALASAVGGLAGLTLNLQSGVVLWSPSSVGSDLVIIRLLLLGASAAIAAVVGYGFRVKPTPKPVEGERMVQQKGVAVESRAPVEPPKIEAQVEEAVQPEYVEIQSRICKFCSSVIPAESVFCPMCGHKLVEV
jgi:hypothetical protein